MTTHEEIAARVAEVFIRVAYVHRTVGNHWPGGSFAGTTIVEMTPDSLKRAMTEALAAFAREYGLEPSDGRPGQPISG